MLALFLILTIINVATIAAAVYLILRYHELFKAIAAKFLRDDKKIEQLERRIEKLEENAA